MKCTFIADLHLSASTAARNAAFREFLERESAWCDELFVLGDLTEVWVGDDDDSEFARGLERDLRDASRRCRVSFLHGNRDFLIGERFAARCDVRLLSDPSLIRIDALRVLLCHGDALCTADAAYQAARAVLRSDAWQHEVLARPLAERRELASTLREQSRAANANKAANIMDVDLGAVRNAVAAHRADVIVHGHTHRPGIHTSTDGVRRYVLGDWNRCAWSLRYDGVFTLACFALARRCET